MGFFKKANLRYRAERIAQEFSKLRQAQFDSTVRHIELLAGKTVEIPQRTLGGDAEKALKGYQLLIATGFFAEHPGLIPDSDFEEFGRNLSMAVIGSSGESVLDYFKEFREYIGDVPQQIVAVSFPVAEHITSEVDAVAATIAAQLLPIFVINSQLVIASMFGDQKSVKELESEMQIVRQALTGE
jgi:hypothetical protein